VGFVVDKVTLELVYSRIFWFPLSVSYKGSTLIWGKNNRTILGRSSERWSHTIDQKKKSLEIFRNPWISSVRLDFYLWFRPCMNLLWDFRFSWLRLWRYILFYVRMICDWKYYVRILPRFKIVQWTNLDFMTLYNSEYMTSKRWLINYEAEVYGMKCSQPNLGFNPSSYLGRLKETTKALSNRPNSTPRFHSVTSRRINNLLLFNNHVCPVLGELIVHGSIFVSEL
jgi:hypothetical protein